MSKKKKKAKENIPESHFILIEGQKLNEKTGELEPYKKKVRWYPNGRCGT